jgi:serine/threonine protein kinase
MDYMRAFQEPDTAKAMKQLADAYLFERQIYDACRDHKLRRVVRAIDGGSVLIDPSQPWSKVEYLIFDLAKGDIRAHLDAQAAFDVAFAVRVIHNIATGLEQLHKAEMAHQDLKPSNVLVFDGDEGSKVTDLGRAWAKSMPSPHDDLVVPGDTGYAPIESLYNGVSPDVSSRRYGCDLYHLGSLIVFMFARTNMNALFQKHLAGAHSAPKWGGTFADVLPYLQAAFGKALEEFEGQVPECIRSDLVTMVKQLCEPDPTRRGHPQNQQYGYGTRHSLERYISKLDLLARRLELGLIRV